jgi:phenylalanyl-tRNA synthetase alpha chain
MMTMSDVETLNTELIARIEAATDLDALEAVRVAALGKQGSVSALLKSLGGMTPEQRQVEGPRINGLRESVTAALAGRKAMLESAALEAKLAAERIDLTLPAAATPKGSVHPVSQVMDELAEIFADMGFAVATGPEIESEWYNFDALNIPPTEVVFKLGKYQLAGIRTLLQEVIDSSIRKGSVYDNFQIK